MEHANGMREASGEPSMKSRSLIIAAVANVALVVVLLPLAYQSFRLPVEEVDLVRPVPDQADDALAPQRKQYNDELAQINDLIRAKERVFKCSQTWRQRSLLAGIIINLLAGC